LPSIIDLVIAGTIAVALALDDDPETGATVGGLAVAGIFGLSGTVGSIYAAKCRNRGRAKSGGTTGSVDSPQPVREPDTLEGARPDFADPESAPPPSRRSLQLPDNYLDQDPQSKEEPKEESKEKEPAKKKRITCYVGDGTGCPRMHLCVATRGYQGFCQPLGNSPAAK